jgi:hypothetical protein
MNDASGSEIIGHCVHVLYGLKKYLHSWDIIETIFFTNIVENELLWTHINLNVKKSWRDDLIKKEIITNKYKYLGIRFCKWVDIFELDYINNEKNDPRELMSKYKDLEAPICLNLTYGFLEPVRDIKFKEILERRKNNFYFFGYS